MQLAAHDPMTKPSQIRRGEQAARALKRERDTSAQATDTRRERLSRLLASLSSQVKVAFDEPNTRALPDMAARVTFLSERPDKAQMNEPARVIVPEVAVTERDGNQVVFVLEDGTARMELVELGEQVGSGYELHKGPPAGAILVREPSSALFDGQKVKQKGEST